MLANIYVLVIRYLRSYTLNTNTAHIHNQYAQAFILTFVLYVTYPPQCMLVHICSPVNQHLGSPSVAILTGNIEWSVPLL